MPKSRVSTARMRSGQKRTTRPNIRATRPRSARARQFSARVLNLVRRPSPLTPASFSDQFLTISEGLPCSVAHPAIRSLVFVAAPPARPFPSSLSYGNHGAEHDSGREATNYSYHSTSDDDSGLAASDIVHPPALGVRSLMVQIRLFCPYCSVGSQVVDRRVDLRAE
jgi:hypothetical protein